MVSQTSRYALRILGYLVEHQGGRIRAEHIAEATSIPANYLSKILNQLRKRGVVDSEKGWGGGFELRPEAHDLSIGEVLTIFESADALDTDKCVFGLDRCDASSPCPLHPFWERIKCALDEMLTTTAIKDLGQRKGVANGAAD